LHRRTYHWHWGPKQVELHLQIMKVDYGPFLSWCAGRGISTPLHLVGDQKYRSMRLPPSEVELRSLSTSPQGLITVVTVPLDACIIGKDLPTLVDRLKYEKSLGDDSAFAPWLNLFPTIDEFQGMPRFWSPDRLEFVKKFDSGQLEARMEIDQQRIDQCDDPWALACVDSRSNFLPDETYSLTPLLDMFNHDAGYKTSARVDGGDRFMLEVASESILSPRKSKTESDNSKGSDWTSQVFGFLKSASNEKKGGYQGGKECFVSYGPFDNVELLSNYGFVPLDNVCNIEQFRVRSIRMGSGAAILVVDSEGTIDNLFNTMSLNALRMSLALPNELDDYNGNGKISDRNEIETYALIGGELEEAIYEAKTGVTEAEIIGDELVRTYLEARRQTLGKGLKWLKAKYPEVF
jgi:hypothetical protein